MRILIGCETSGIGRRAFASRGHAVISVDIHPADDGAGWGGLSAIGWHWQGDLMPVLRNETPINLASFDLGIFHPECTRLCNSGVRWLAERGLWDEMEAARTFFMACHDAGIPAVIIENPVPHRHARLPPYAQIVHPWQHGHREMKPTCLWIRNRPLLIDTDVVGPPPAEKSERVKWQKIHRASPGANRSKERSRSYPGIMNAMAAQWG
jgi:hypothetical protein